MKKLLCLGFVAAVLSASVGCDEKKTTASTKPASGGTAAGSMSASGGAGGAGSMSKSGS